MCLRRCLPLPLLALLGGFLLCGLQQRCAQPVTLTGGPKDTIPPVLNAEKSTPGLQTHFTKQDIVLHFDEFVEVRDVFNQVVVSPPLENVPQIMARGKTINVSFDESETLKQDATYTIFFNEAIRDFTEGNTLKNFRFVFATGAMIDSLSLAGQVIDVESRKGMADVLVMLYENTEDSVVYKERPFYFAKTDNSGRFALSNLKAGAFKVFALKDANLNYLYDQESEAIGFVDTLIQVTDSIPPLSIDVFLPEQSPRLLGEDTKQYGVIRVQLNRVIESVRASFLGVEPTYTFVEKKKDSVLIWYDLPIDTSFRLAIEGGETLRDTINVRRVNRPATSDTARLAFVGHNTQRSKHLKAGEALELTFAKPIRSVDTSLIRSNDSTGVLWRAELDSLRPRTILLYPSAFTADSLSIRCLPGAVRSVYGRFNDSIRVDLQMAAPEQLGAIRLLMTDLDTSSQYVVVLMDQQNELEQRIVAGEEPVELFFRQLDPKAYGLRIIEDITGNGRWDVGNYAEKRQSERLINRTLETLRENWELEVTLSMADLFPPKSDE